jgi:hypothetical protein
VNKNNLTKGLFTALLLVSSVVSADEKYPAADFQPSVVYQDENYIKNNSSTQTAVKNAAPVVAEAKTEVDSKYPAADFQPKVIYSDDKYQHNKSAPASSSKNISTSSDTEETKTESTVVSAEKKKEDSSVTYLLGLVGLGAVGFFLFRKQETAASATTKKASVAPASSKTAATTGVGKYLNKVSGTGVSRYVEKQVKTAKSATGVAKYVAQQTLAEKARAAEEAEKKATGVEKYMRNRG